jgi:V-type H+-transporting ATPase subunit D
MTNRRVNALEHVMIPRLENTISYINSECVHTFTVSFPFRIDGWCVVRNRLDEMDREEFFRLKKIQSKKKRDNAVKEEAETAARVEREAREDADAAQTGYGAGAGAGNTDAGTSGERNLLADKDEDGESRCSVWTLCLRPD